MVSTEPRPTAHSRTSAENQALITSKSIAGDLLKSTLKYRANVDLE